MDVTPTARFLGATKNGSLQASDPNPKACGILGAQVTSSKSDAPTICAHFGTALAPAPGGGAWASCHASWRACGGWGRVVPPPGRQASELSFSLHHCEVAQEQIHRFNSPPHGASALQHVQGMLGCIVPPCGSIIARCMEHIMPVRRPHKTKKKSLIEL